MRWTVVILAPVLLTLSACMSARLSQDEARKKISEIARSNLVPDAIEIRRIVSQTDTQAIAESNVTLAFHFKKDKPDTEWKIDAVRLGDRDWINLDELLAAINEGRRKTTTQKMQKLASGIEKFRQSNGSLPSARDIVGLTDVLNPLYVDELIRQDGWANDIDYTVTGGSTFRLVSRGADGRLGTPDDIVVDEQQANAP